MAHNLRIVDGKAAIAFTGETPWHGLGTQCQDAMTASEAIQKGGLDWQVTKEPLYLANGIQAPCYATVASDTGAYLGTVGAKYEPLQNSEAFGFFDDLIGQGAARYQTVGALGNGERIWLLAKMPESIEVVKGDAIESYILLSNSHDGSSAVEARYTSIRVVCQNTLHMATKDSAAVVRLRHTQTIVQRLSQAAMILSGYQDHLGQFADCMRLLQKVRVNDDMLAQFEATMFGDMEKTPEGRGRTVLSNNLQKYEELYISGRGTEIPGVVGTAYGMLNAYTEWSDYHSMVKGTDDRTNAIVFGAASKKKAQAFELALSLSK